MARLTVTQKFQVKTLHRKIATHGLDSMLRSGEATEI
jgi:hypothetical protein